MISLDLAVNAIVSGLLLGGFYAAVTVGVTISFGMLDIVNIAHPAFIMLGSFVAYIVNSSFGIDPILIGVVMSPAFFLAGMAVYAFERRGEESIQGLAFFFGLLFVGEVGLILVFGVDYRFVAAPYIGPSLHLGFADLPLRMLVPFLVSLLMLAVLQVFLGRTFIGRAILAVSQDRLALQLMAANPSPASSAPPSASRSPPPRSPAPC
jgi:branched-chain amino acid transport system permease protein